MAMSPPMQGGMPLCISQQVVACTPQNDKEEEIACNQAIGILRAPFLY